MKFSEFYSNAQKELLRTFTSMFSKGKPEYSGHLQYILGEKEKEKLMIEPVFQSVFPWESDKHRIGDLCGLLGESFIDALDKAVFSEPMTDNDKEVKVENVAFPKNINPYLHQVKSWEAVLKKRKSILVTTGTGSGKTECFMVPVLKQLYDDKIKAGINNPGVQAIFLYPLNALIASQRKRIHGWCKALNPSVTYGIYTGETKESATKRETESYFPQIIDRQTLRSRPPQILFTNATILEYMMIRASDNELIAKSSDLKWIILDEAHTYNGSSATEMALLIKRILQVFGKKPEEVNFAITSATIGEGKEAEMKEFISRLTGKNASDFEFITGKRVIPQPDADSVKSRIDEINAKTGYRITPAAIKKVREKLNNNPSLSATEITDELKCKNISTVERLELIDMLSEAGTVKVAGNDSSALLPVRGHFMARSLNGLYACSNPECKSYKENHIDIGSLTSFRASNCPDCGGRMLEVVACGDCGSYLLQGEKELIKDMNSTEPEKYYMKDNTLENDLLVDWDPDIDRKSVV